ncbi:MAG: hypothetical protein ABIH46_05430 [Chloroflexota bacterium]
MTKLDNLIDKHISALVGVFTDPILVFPGGWGDTLHEWLKQAVTLERLEMNVRGLGGEQPTGTDAEACAYLYTAALTQPMDHDWSQIYLYIAGKTYARTNRGEEIPEDIKVESLTDHQTEQLNHFRQWLYQKRTQVRLEKDKRERRHRKEEVAARMKTAQPALFDF